MNYHNYLSRFNLFTKNYKNISISESSENLLNSTQPTSSEKKITKTDSIEFTDFVGSEYEIEEFANFSDHLFIDDTNIIDTKIPEEVSNTIEYLVNYCEVFYKEFTYELVGNISNLLYKEDKLVYVVRVNDPEQFTQYKINTYNIVGIEGIFYWNEKSILQRDDKVLVECTYLGRSCKYKSNKIIKKL